MLDVPGERLRILEKETVSVGPGRFNLFTRGAIFCGILQSRVKYLEIGMPRFRIEGETFAPIVSFTGDNDGQAAHRHFHPDSGGKDQTNISGIDQIISIDFRSRRQQVDILRQFREFLAQNIVDRRAPANLFARMHADNKLHIITLGKIFDGAFQPLGHARAEDVPTQGERITENIGGQQNHGTGIQS